MTPPSALVFQSRAHRGRLHRIRLPGPKGHNIPMVVFDPPPQKVCLGTFLTPPLLGGDPLQQFAFFQPLSDAGWRLASLGYRGHRRTRGRFHLLATGRDTVSVARHLISKYASRPLVALGTCFGSLPVLHALQHLGRHFQGAVFVNAILHPRHVCSLTEALSVCREQSGVHIRHPLDFNGRLHALARNLFPGVESSRAHFGTLRFARIHPWRCLAQYLFGSGPERFPDFRGPSLCCYGRRDSLLRLDCPERQKRYESRFQRAFPEICFFRHAADHWWQGQEDVLHRAILNFLHQLTPAASKSERTRWA